MDHGEFNGGYEVPSGCIFGREPLMIQSLAVTCALSHIRVIQTRCNGWLSAQFIKAVEQVSWSELISSSIQANLLSLIIYPPPQALLLRTITFLQHDVA